MKLITLGANAHVLEVGDSKFLFSYETLVAAIHNNTAYQPATNYSRATSKHVSKFMNHYGYGHADLHAFHYQLVAMAEQAAIVENKRNPLR